MGIQSSKVIRLVINKSIVPKQKKRRGRKGYGNVLIVRLLVFAILVGIFSNRGLHTYLKQHKTVRKMLGFKTVPHRTTIARWKANKRELLEQTITNLGNFVTVLVYSKLLVIDSSPIPDINDSEGRWGRTGRGWFFGFKIHTVINQLKIPLRAKFTTGNVHDHCFYWEIQVTIQRKTEEYANNRG